MHFPHVFGKRGGFDIVVGNPPWEQLQLDSREWFAEKAPDIAGARHHAARSSAVEELRTSDPSLFAEFSGAQRRNEGVQAFAHASGRFPRTSNGRLNTAPLFAEMTTEIVSQEGMSSLLVPTGIATDSFTQLFFQYLIESSRLRELLSFENEAFLFPAVHHATKFCILTVGGERKVSPTIHLVFFARQVEDLKDRERQVVLQEADFRLFNPNTTTCPTFHWRRDADLNRQIYGVAGVFVTDGVSGANPWGFRGLLMFMMNTDSYLFRTHSALEDLGYRLVGTAFHNDATGDVYLPLVEAKMLHMFDHRFGTYAGQSDSQSNQGKLPELDDVTHADPSAVALPDYWVPRAETMARVEGKWSRKWFLGWRDICRSTDQRTVIPVLFPLSGVGHTLPVLLSSETAAAMAGLYANLSCYLLDYAARQKIGGTHLTYTYLKQLPVLPPKVYQSQAKWAGTDALAWILPRVLELTYTAWDLKPFAEDVGYDGPPFRWDPERRFLLRCELDAAFFHLYGLSHADTEYVMDTFPIVRKNDMKVYKKFRTKDMILEIYDALAEATRTGKPYQTPLEPPPAEPRVAPSDTSGAIVIPFPTRPKHRPLPEWDDQLFAEVAARAQLALEPGKWATSLTGYDLGMNALAAVLRNLSGPCAREDVERAVVLALLPTLMRSAFKHASAQREWVTIIGSENLAVSSVSSFEIPWRTVIHDAVKEHVLQVSSDGLWNAGTEIAYVPSPVFDARALVVLAWLATAPEKDAEVTRQMGDLHVA